MVAKTVDQLSATGKSPTLSDSLPAVSRTLELSLQSSLQLSLTVLVGYRPRSNI